MISHNKSTLPYEEHYLMKNIPLSYEEHYLMKNIPLPYKS